MHHPKLKRLKKTTSLYKSLFFGETENSDFGHSLVLKEYANVDQHNKLRGRYQHGWLVFGEYGFWKNNFLPTYVWNKEYADIALKRGWKNFIPIGSSWLYFLELLSRKGLSLDQTLECRQIQELWVFGKHSTATYESNQAELKEFIKSAIDSSATNKVVLLYDTDYSIYLRKFPHLSSQISITTLGPRRNSIFSEAHFFNLFALLSKTETLVTDHPTSMVCYAVTLDVNILWHKNASYSQALAIADSWGSKQLQSFLREPKVLAHEYLPYIYRELGKESMKSEKDLREIFSWDLEPLKKSRLFLSLLSSSLVIPWRLVRSSWGTRF